MKKLILILLTSLSLVFTANSKTLTVQEVYQYILKTGVMAPEYVLAQSCLETGWYKSYNYRVRNNLFGFRYYKWVTPDNKMGYKVFKSWRESIEYYRDWQIRKGYTDGTSYTHFLDKVGYAENPNYVRDLLWVKQRLKVKFGIG